MLCYYLVNVDTWLHYTMKFLLPRHLMLLQHSILLFVILSYFHYLLTLFYSCGLMLTFYSLPEALTGIPIEPQREKRRRRRKEGTMTMIITQSCHTREVRKKERATSQNITRKTVNTTMDFIQRNIGIQTGKMTERTIWFHPTTPHNQMVQLTTI